MVSVTAVGDVLADRYRLVSQIAIGGMGLVWEGWDELLLRRVAVKQLLAQPALGEQEIVIARNRVIREARITARLHHPHAVTLYDVVDQAGYPCLIMQFVPSVALSSVLQKDGWLPSPVVSRIGADIASALVAAHAVGIVHRDVKPGNVLITDDGSAKLTDFGISHAVGDITLTATGMVSGTPAYLAPEVARGADSGFPADVFSLGSTLYAALEGSPPFGTDSNPMAILHRVGSGRIDPPRRSGSLTPLLLRMLAPDPANRPVMLEVAQALAGRPIEVRTLQDVPPTAVISAQTVREPGPNRVPGNHPLQDARVDSAPPAASTDASDRRKRTGVVLAVVAAMIAALTLTGYLFLQPDDTPQAAVAATTQPSGPTELSATAPIASAAERSVPNVAPASPDTLASVTTPTPRPSLPELPLPPEVENQSAQPTTSTPDTPTPATAQPTTAEPALPVTVEPQEATSSSPTATDLAAAVTDYYALMPADTDGGWAHLTSNFQTGIAQNRQYYESFWGAVDLVRATDVSGAAPDQAEATITYSFADGTVSVERTTYRLVQDEGILKIDSSTVLSSRTG